MEDLVNIHKKIEKKKQGEQAERVGKLAGQVFEIAKKEGLTVQEVHMMVRIVTDSLNQVVSGKKVSELESEVKTS